MSVPLTRNTLVCLLVNHNIYAAYRVLASLAEQSFKTDHLTEHMADVRLALNPEIGMDSSTGHLLD